MEVDVVFGGGVEETEDEELVTKETVEAGLVVIVEDSGTRVLEIDVNVLLDDDRATTLPTPTATTIIETTATTIILAIALREREDVMTLR